MIAIKILLLLSLFVACAEGYPKSIVAIPNGSRVPNPNRPGSTWPAVGHLDPNGAGALNSFGKAFQNAGYKWTRDLCQSDSDGDGRTNGQELGDPKCTWTEGKPAPAGRITHPGVRD